MGATHLLGMDIGYSMKNNMDRYQGLPEQIIAHAERKLTNSAGLFVEGISIEGVKLEKIVVDDLGDFIPFIGYFGREDIVDRHLTFLEHERDHIVFNRAFAYTDFLFGLLWYARIGVHAERARKLAAHFGKAVEQRFFSRIFSSYAPGGFALPLFNTLDATFIEVWTEFYRETKDERYLIRAGQLARMLGGSVVFSHYGLIPEIIPTGPLAFLGGMSLHQKLLRARLMKNNTSFGFGLVDLYSCTHDTEIGDLVDRLVFGIRDRALAANGVMAHALTTGDCRAYLTPSFAVIDFLCDAYHALARSEYLSIARAVADFWLKEQSRRTGLFPNIAGEKASYSDSETDMAVALFKLSELTGDVQYEDAAHRALIGMIDYHFVNDEFYLQVDIDTGAVIDRREKTKFSLLFLKPFIRLIEGGSIYGSEKLFMLLKDR